MDTKKVLRWIIATALFEIFIILSSFLTIGFVDFDFILTLTFFGLGTTWFYLFFSSSKHIFITTSWILYWITVAGIAIFYENIPDQVGAVILFFAGFSVIFLSSVATGIFSAIRALIKMKKKNAYT